MKKLIWLLFACWLLFQITLAVYVPTSSDRKILHNIEQKIESLMVQHPTLKSSLKLPLQKAMQKPETSEQVKRILNELYKHLYNVSSTTTTTNWSTTTTNNATCTIFPSDNPWNTDISHYPVHANSANYISTITARKNRLHPDFGANRDGGPFGIPYVIVWADQAKVPVKAVRYPDESDQWNFPVPLTAPIEKWWDHHVIAVDMDACMLYELYAAEKVWNTWEAWSTAVFNMKTNALRPDGWTSADAAWLPIFPGLVRYDEVAAWSINHALRFTLSKTQKAYIAPATHYASSDTSANQAPMWLRFRLKADFDISWYTGQSKIILTALKKYWMIVADNWSDRYISGAPDSRWSDEDLWQLKKVPWDAFEVVDTWPIQK